MLQNEEFLGMDTDEVFAYSTKKIVWIRDRWIGAFYYSVVGLVLLWVFGGQILWKNDHFLRKDVNGMPRMTISHPTVDGCEAGEPGCKSDFERLSTLPYCDAYAGRDPSPGQSPCSYIDRVTMGNSVSRMHMAFIPTAVEIVTERRSCHPSASNNFSCSNVWETITGSDCLHGKYLCKNRGGRTRQFSYVADVDDFTVRFSSSYERDHIRGTSLMHQAFMGICPKLLKLHNTTQTWSKRKEYSDEWCSETELELVKLPCGRGMNCADMRAFDILEDTGLNVATRKFRSAVKAGGKGEEGSQDTASLLGVDRAERGALGGISFERQRP